MREASEMSVDFPEGSGTWTASVRVVGLARSYERGTGNDRTHSPTEDPVIRAAEYVRMSTEHQKYSTENQADAIREYKRGDRRRRRTLGRIDGGGGNGGDPARSPQGRCTYAGRMIGGCAIGRDEIGRGAVGCLA